MSRKDKPRGVDLVRDSDDLGDLQPLEGSERGYLERDAEGNPVSKPTRNLGRADAIARLLGEQDLTIEPDPPSRRTRRIEPNPAGLGKGYDPYDSGLLVKKEWRKKKDLRALSKWIKQKRRSRPDGE